MRVLPASRNARLSRKSNSDASTPPAARVTGVRCSGYDGDRYRRSAGNKRPPRTGSECGGPGWRGVVSAIEESSGSIAHTIDPVLRRRGYGANMVLKMMAAPALQHVSLCAAGTVPENTASVECLLSAAFRPLDLVVDWKGNLPDARRRA
jgi:hypothetical protein